MGYSVTRSASITQQAITEFCVKQTQSQNTYIDKGVEYMIEFSRKSSFDGEITGSIYKILDGKARKCNSLKIDRDGHIVRAPKILKNIRICVLKTCYHDTAELVHLWPDECGEPNQDNLMKAILKGVECYKEGGHNYHLTKALGYIPYPTSVKLINQKTGEEICSWTAGEFQVW